MTLGVNETLFSQIVLNQEVLGPTSTTWTDVVVFLLILASMVYLMRKWHDDWHDKVKRSKMLNGLKRFGGR